MNPMRQRGSQRQPDERLPNQSHSARRQRLGISTAYYFGQVLGYVSIAQDAAASPEIVMTTSQLHSRFTEAQAAAFDAGFGSVTSAHAELMDQLAALRIAAQSDERGHRENRMIQLQQERDATLAELEQIEILRAENRQRSSEERNVHAATRSQVRNSSINTYAFITIQSKSPFSDWLSLRGSACRCWPTTEAASPSVLILVLGFRGSSSRMIRRTSS